MWILFRSRDKLAIKVFVRGVNAVSGEPMLGNAATTLGGLNRKSQGKTLQDYLMTPQQLWLDGVASHDGQVRQFEAVSSESRYSVEFQVTGEEVVGGLQFETIPPVLHPNEYLPPNPRAAGRQQNYAPNHQCIGEIASQLENKSCL